MKLQLQLFASTAAVLFSGLSGSVATSLRGVAITSDVDAADSSDYYYYPEVEDYDFDSADYYPESEEDYDFDDKDDEEEEDPDDVGHLNEARQRLSNAHFVDFFHIDKDAIDGHHPCVHNCNEPSDEVTKCSIEIVDGKEKKICSKEKKSGPHLLNDSRFVDRSSSRPRAGAGISHKHKGRSGRHVHMHM